MRDSSSVPGILSFKSQMRIPNRSSSLKVERSGGDSPTFVGFSLGSAASINCILTEGSLGGHWRDGEEHWSNGGYGVLGSWRKMESITGVSILRYGATVPGRCGTLPSSSSSM